MRPRDVHRILTLLPVGLIAAVVASSLPGDSLGSESASASAVPPSTASVPDWPQFRGPRRDGTSDETGLLSAWPDSGPPLAWTAKDLGRGYSSPIVVGDSIYITGDVGADLVIEALDLEGQPRWKAKHGASWRGSFPGSRASCTHDAGRLYLMNAHGRLACLEASSGKEVWAVDVLERFGAANGTWGMSESVLVDGKKVVVTVGGTKALLAALDATSGETVWTCPPLEGEKTAHSSVLLVPGGKRRLLVNAGTLRSFAVDAETGALVWAHRHPVPENVLGASPAFVSGSVYIANSSRDHNALYRLRLDPTEGSSAGDAGPPAAWSIPVKNGQGGLVLASGRLWGGNGLDEEDGLSAIDPDSGAIAKVPGGLGFGAAAWADGRIYYLSQKGEAALLEPTGASARIVGRFRFVTPRQNDAWAHPVICRGRFYLRYHDELRAYDIRASRPR